MIMILATLSFTEVLEQMREHLSTEGYTQIPQLSSMNPIDVNHKFDLVPDTATGTRRAVMIGINYVGKSRGQSSAGFNIRKKHCIYLILFFQFS